MAYTPTSWTNGSEPPVSAANLNKIEQGVKAAHDLAEAAAPASHTHTPASIGAAPASHTHGAADLSGVVKTVNGTGPDSAGNVTVAGGGGGGVALPFVAPVAHIIDQTVTTDNSGNGNWSALVPGAAVSVSNAHAGDTTRIALNTISLPACTISDLSIQVATAGAAESVIRFGIWSADAKGKPDTLVLDSGALDAASTGWKTVTPATPLILPAGAYWIGAACSDSAVRYAGWEAAFPPKFGGPDSGHTKMRTSAGAWSGSALPATLTIGRTNQGAAAAPVLYAKVTL